MSVVLPVAATRAAASRPPTREITPATAVPEQIRVCVHVGDYFVDTSLSAHTPLTVVMEGLVGFLADTLRAEGLVADFAPTGVYSLAVEGGMPFVRTATLAEAGVLDGARLLLREVESAEVFSPIIEDGSDALAEFNAVKFAAFSAGTARALGLLAVVAGSAVFAVLTVAAWWALPSASWWLPPSAAVTALLAGGAVVAQRRGATALSWVGGLAALPPAFAAGWVAVPAPDDVAGTATTANAFSAAVAATAVSLLIGWLTGVGVTVHTAAVTGGAVAAAAFGVATYTGFDARQIGTTAVLVGMAVVAAAPAVALALARVRPPSLPVPGEDIDRRELDEAAMVVEVFDGGDDMRTVALSSHDEDTVLERRSRVANKYLTGLFAAAVAVVVAGATAAVGPRDHHLPGELALGVVAAAVLALRARSLTDRVQAVLFHLGAALLPAGLAVVMVTGGQGPGATLVVLGLVVVVTAAAVVGGLRLPGTKPSPITLRRIEQLEFLLILSIAPLAFWIVGVYAALRNLR